MSWLSRKTAIVMLALLAGAVGCQQVPTVQKKSPFKSPPMSRDSCVLELFFVRFPFGDAEANQSLWQEIDELQSAPDLHQRLLRNGFRVGLLSGQIPSSLVHLMELTTKPPVAQEDEQIKLTDLADKPRVTRGRMHARPGQRHEIVTSGVYEQLPVLVREGDQVGGRTYEQAQGVLALKAFPQTDGRVQIELLPELQYGQPKRSWVPDQGVWRSDFGRPKRTFEDLALTATLAPGSILVVASLPDCPGSLGHYFFTEKDGRPEQKMLLIRLIQTQQDDLFAPSEVLPLE